jgi:hypothetical protein
MDLMARKSKTQQLVESSLGQHLALSVAAHLARTQLVPDPLGAYDGQHLTEMVDVVANALARVAPLYVQDPKQGSARELTPLELDGAAVRRAATLLVLKDGRTLSSVSMKRADLRQAIAILKATGIPGLRRAPANSAAEPKAPLSPPLAQQVAELESLLRLPLIEAQVEKASRLALALARHARQGRVANFAMQLLSAVYEVNGQGEADERRLNLALARLRAAVEALEQSDAARG